MGRSQNDTKGNKFLLARVREKKNVLSNRGAACAHIRLHNNQHIHAHRQVAERFPRLAAILPVVAGAKIDLLAAPSGYNNRFASTCANSQGRNARHHDEASGGGAPTPCRQSRRVPPHADPPPFPFPAPPRRPARIRGSISVTRSSPTLPGSNKRVR